MFAFDLMQLGIQVADDPLASLKHLHHNVYVMKITRICPRGGIEGSLLRFLLGVENGVIIVL